MEDIHRRLIEVALPVIEPYGFVLAGGYAISAHGIGERPSADVDLFTTVNDPTVFGKAVDTLHAALDAAGFEVSNTVISDLFADFHVTDLVSGVSTDMQMGVNYREFPPARLEIGPVLDVRDAVAGKMSALWSRGEVRDYIDIDAVIQSGRFTRDDVLAIGDSQEFHPMDRHMLAERFRMAASFDAEEWSPYNVSRQRYADIVGRYQQWADEIESV